MEGIIVLQESQNVRLVLYPRYVSIIRNLKKRRICSFILLFMIMIHLIEPMWGQRLLLWMHQVMQFPFFFHWLPVAADVFVFVYPVYLFVVYVYGIRLSHKGIQ